MSDFTKIGLGKSRWNVCADTIHQNGNQYYYSYNNTIIPNKPAKIAGWSPICLLNTPTAENSARVGECD